MKNNQNAGMYEKDPITRKICLPACATRLHQLKILNVDVCVNLDESSKYPKEKEFFQSNYIACGLLSLSSKKTFAFVEIGMLSFKTAWFISGSEGREFVRPIGVGGGRKGRLLPPA